MVFQNNSIRGKVALVTGASSGIGRAVAKELAFCGARVVACARRVEKLHQLQQEIAQQQGEGELHAMQVDLRQEKEILALFEKIAEIHGGLDILINNAGLGYAAPLMNGESEHWREMLEVNVLALCICTREAIQQMASKEQGQIIHISSLAGHRIPLKSGVYSASKFAVRSLTEGLRAELHEAGSPVRVTAISPGLVETEFMPRYHQDEERGQQVYDQCRKVLDAQDVAQAVSYVLAQPPHVQVHDILLRSKYQES